MTSTIPRLELNAGVWVDVYAVTGITRGLPLEITLTSGQSLRGVVEKNTGSSIPTTDDNDGVFIPMDELNRWYKLKSENDALYIISDYKTFVYIQEIET